MPMGGLPLLIVLVLMLVAGGLWLGGQRMRDESGLPDGDVIYSDSGAWQRNHTVLHARSVRLVGKPDYLVRQNDGVIIPVEVKSSPAPKRPWEGQVLQLAAYCLLVEETHGIRPPYGILQYKDDAFAVTYTPELELDLLDLLAEMGDAAATPDLSRDHDDVRRCAGCGVRQACDERLA